MWEGNHIDSIDRHTRVIRLGFELSAGRRIWEFANRVDSGEPRTRLFRVGAFYSAETPTDYRSVVYANADCEIQIRDAPTECQWDLGDLISLVGGRNPTIPLTIISTDIIPPTATGSKKPTNVDLLRQQNIYVTHVHNIYSVEGLETFGPRGEDVRNRLLESWDNYKVLPPSPVTDASTSRHSR